MQAPRRPRVEPDIVADDVTFDPDAREGALSADRLTARCREEMTFALVRATRRYASGRWYVEFILHLPPGQRQPGAWTDAGIVARAPSRIVGYGARGTLGEEIADGDVIGLAIDLEAARLYVRRNGTWVDGAPGNAGVGIAIGHTRRAYVVAVAISRRPVAGESDAWSVNFGGAPFAHPVPPGYRSYDGRQHGAPVVH